MLPALFTGFPVNAVTKEEKIPIKKYARDPVAWLAICIITLGVISEISSGSWMVNYLEKVYLWSPAQAAGMLSAFFLTFTLARLVLGPLTDRIGYIKSLIIFPVCPEYVLFQACWPVNREPSCLLPPAPALRRSIQP